MIMMMLMMMMMMMIMIMNINNDHHRDNFHSKKYSNIIQIAATSISIHPEVLCCRCSQSSSS